METSTTKHETDNAQAGENSQARPRFSLEVSGEIVLLLMVGGFFIYLFIGSLQWSLGSALMPWITVSIGFPFWLYRLLVLFVRAGDAPGQIMDIGFRTGGDPTGERARFFQICFFIVCLYLAIWLFGFHIALPAGMLFYLRVYGQVSWWWSCGTALLFLGLIIGVYDRLLGATWHEPPVLVLLNSFF